MKTPTSTIWKTVVFSAALIGGTVTLGCKNKNESTMDPCADPCADPCKGKMSPGGGDEYGGDEYGEDYDSRGEWDEGGDVGRGFVLS